MGTSGSGAGGGSGGFGGGGGGGGGGRGAGIVTVSGGSLKSKDAKQVDAFSAIQSCVSRLKRDYMAFTFGDPGVRAAYEALHTLHVLLVQDKSWEKVEKLFGVPGTTNGCLIALADALSDPDGLNHVQPYHAAELREALKDFFLRVVGDKVSVCDRGDAAAVLRAVRPEPFQSTSALFFSSYLAECLRPEDQGLTRQARKYIREFALAKANQLVAAFETAFKGRAWGDTRQVGFRHLFQVIQGEPEWFVEQLRKPLDVRGRMSPVA